MDYKVKIVNIAKAHSEVKPADVTGKRMLLLKRKEAFIKMGKGITKEKVTTRNLQKWALAAAGQFPDLEFKATESWITKFKNKYGIRQRKITKFVSKMEAATIEEILASATTFQKQIHSNSYQILLKTMLLIMIKQVPKSNLAIIELMLKKEKTCFC